MEKLYKITEAAKLLSVTRQTVYRWCEEGTLHIVRIKGNPRIRESELKSLVKEDTK